MRVAFGCMVDTYTLCSSCLSAAIVGFPHERSRNWHGFGDLTSIPRKVFFLLLGFSLGALSAFTAKMHQFAASKAAFFFDINFMT